MEKLDLPTISYSKERVERILNKYWYYSVEYAPGRFTKGQNYTNVCLTRELLKNADVKGKDILDLGTMEGVIPTLLTKRGARTVNAFDILDSTEQINFVKTTHDVEFYYHTNIHSSRILDFCKTRSAAVPQFMGKWYDVPVKGFDIVISSGMLYHSFSPLDMIGTVRSLVKKNGLVIIETAVIEDERYLMQYNYAGKDYAEKSKTYYYYGWSDVWFISLPMLDYLLRFFRMIPIDLTYFRQFTVDGHKILRVAIAARPTEDFVAFEGESLLKESTCNFDYRVLFDENFLKDEPSTRVDYRRDPARPMFLRDHPTAIDVMRTVQNHPPLDVNAEKAKLRLTDVY